MDGSRDRNRAAKVMQGRQQAQKGLNEGSLSQHLVQNKRHGNHCPGTHLASKEPTCMSNYRDLLLATGFPGGSDGKESACDARDPGSIPGSGRSPGDGLDGRHGLNSHPTSQQLSGL